jgi:hypothetical protein
MLKSLYSALLILAAGHLASAQPWMEAPYLKAGRKSEAFRPANFYEIQKAFNRFEKEQLRKARPADNEDAGKDEGEFPGYNQYKRWEAYMEPRV